eukprot:TRINITY_DN65130_c0_g1_i1.p1 TRINITY_DN65130_c0_g1~~TRINITY_DN65130_c0_g1_i1.p1  ORF type:complete len:395 (+),score=73.36 TRINITY_DN65130_c0_g1_i1:112-1185(+)
MAHWALLGFTFAIHCLGSVAINVDLYKIANGECGQASIDKELSSVAERFAGLKEGTCAALGYKESVGKRELDLPMLGHLEFQLFKKADMLDLSGAINLALGKEPEQSGPCCSLCNAPAVRYYSINTPKRQCGEACIDPATLWLVEMFVENLTQAGSQNCASFGYSSYNKTVTHGVKPVSLSMDFYSVPSPSTSSGKVLVHQVIRGECGQAMVDANLKSTLVNLVGLIEGPCSDAGFLKPEGSHELALPMLGNVRFEIYGRPGDLDFKDAMRFGVAAAVGQHLVPVRKMLGPLCGEAQLDAVAALTATSMGVEAGGCSDVGFAVPKGSQDLLLPGVGVVELTLYASGSAPSAGSELHV